MADLDPSERLAAAEAALKSFEKLVDEAAQEGIKRGTVWSPVVHELGKRIRARLNEYGQTRVLEGVLYSEREATLNKLRDAVKDMAARKDTDGKVYGQHTTIDPDDVLALIESLRG